MRYNYVLGTGYHHRDIQDHEFSKLWWRRNYMDNDPQMPSLCVTTGPKKPLFPWDYIFIPGTNFGHVGDLLNGTRQGPLCGWSVCVLALAMNAFAMGRDLLFVEQDCLCFGPWIERVHQDIGDADIVFGPQMQSPPYMACAQALFLLRHHAIPRFIEAYLAMPEDAELLPESKFAKLDQHGIRVAHLSFGVDRERPIPWDAEVFYAQQMTPGELQEMEQRGLLK